jgi:hypothetical protein
MKYIGNFSSWITPTLMNHLEFNDGDCTPVWQPEKWQGNTLLDHYREMARPVYSKNSPVFHQFNEKSKDMQNFDIALPILPEKRKYCFWWFVKLLPGEMQAMHIDPHLVEVSNPVRYTMFLQDWEIGHIFVYENKMLSDYKAGDIYEWSDPMTVHGVTNIGYKTRFTLQITMHD